MGFDCTLHVVDDVSLKRFVDRFLGRTSAKAPFDDACPNAEELIAKTKELLAGPDLEAAGRTLGELAILYVSAETPHATSRGFSLSLWDEDRMGAPTAASPQTSCRHWATTAVSVLNRLELLWRRRESNLPGE